MLGDVKLEPFDRWRLDWGGPPDPPLSAGAYVYVMRASNGYVKIGRSRDVDGRRAVLQTASPFLIEVVHMIPVLNTKEAARIEAEWHRVFGLFRLRGEWFDLPDEMVAYIGEMRDPEQNHNVFTLPLPERASD